MIEPVLLEAAFYIALTLASPLIGWGIYKVSYRFFDWIIQSREKDRRIKECLETLTEMRYFNEQHKMKRLAWDAINALDPELAKLDETEAYRRVHGE